MAVQYPLFSKKFISYLHLLSPDPKSAPSNPEENIKREPPRKPPTNTNQPTIKKTQSETEQLRKMNTHNDDKNDGARGALPFG